MMDLALAVPMREIVPVLENLEIAKDEANLEVEDICEKYGLSRVQRKMILVAAKAQLKKKIENAKKEAKCLIAIIASQEVADFKEDVAELHELAKAHDEEEEGESKDALDEEFVAEMDIDHDADIVAEDI